jgi:hypothetical protein
MENHDRVEGIMWREETHRCELWETGAGHELRVYVSDVLTHTEPVRFTTRGLQQAARLLATARAAIYGSIQ